MADGDAGYKVSLNVYDLSNGLARQFSAAFLGKPIEAIWHTGVVVYGTEYYFSGGIQRSPSGDTPFGAPLRVVDLGVTHLPKEVFEDYLSEISPRYTADTYRLLTHNCNNFSNEVANFLVGAGIPAYILDLPNEVMSSPMAPLIMPMIQQLETSLRDGGVPQNSQFRPSLSSTASKPVTSSPPSTDPISSPVKAQPQGTAGADPLDEARVKVREEITREFAAIMASGTLRASEAATLAMRRVMERRGPSSSAVGDPAHP